nr:uncharacterized protein LOC127487127 [Oryctolagus cuniculus]
MQASLGAGAAHRHLRTEAGARCGQRTADGCLRISLSAQHVLGPRLAESGGPAGGLAQGCGRPDSAVLSRRSAEAPGLLTPGRRRSGGASLGGSGSPSASRAPASSSQESRAARAGSARRPAEELQAGPGPSRCAPATTWGRSRAGASRAWRQRACPSGNGRRRTLAQAGPGDGAAAALRAPGLGRVPGIVHWSGTSKGPRNKNLPSCWEVQSTHPCSDQLYSLHRIIVFIPGKRLLPPAGSLCKCLQWSGWSRSKPGGRNAIQFFRAVTGTRILKSSSLPPMMQEADVSPSSLGEAGMCEDAWPVFKGTKMHRQGQSMLYQAESASTLSYHTGLGICLQ